jgi:GTP1/Obg family GTP-binding protein
MGECEKEGKHFGELCDKMEKTYQQHVSSSIKAIDQHLEELNRLRNELSELYE